MSLFTDIVSNDPNFHRISSASELPPGFKPDFVVEQYLTEFKLDHDAIMETYETLLKNKSDELAKHQMRKLYPEWDGKTSLVKDELPKTVHRKVYFAQSPRKNNSVAEYYSVEQHMLIDLRAQRSRVKKDLAHAQAEHNDLEAVRFNAKQLAIKVVCNTQYGASNNAFFAKYDPEVSGCVTHTSRQTIAFLSACLETDKLFIDDEFIENNKTELEALKSIGALSYKRVRSTIIQRKHRRLCVQRIFDEFYNIRDIPIYMLTLEPSTVVYQDTDSNYYINRYIINHYTDNLTVVTPERIDALMHMMLNHDMLIAHFVTDGINRRPISPGFEGAFMICRYLNRKKKYYGVKWGADEELTLASRLPDEAYDSNGVLKVDYLKWWRPKQTVYPQPNGEYITIDTHKLLDEGTNMLDYIRSQNVKCTGVDLARRDQFRFINYFHIYILQQDLRLMRYEGNDKWEMFKLDEEIEPIISRVIDQLVEILHQYSDMSIFNKRDGHIIHPSIPFDITAFSKTVAYKTGTANIAADIIARLEREGKTAYVPGAGSRITYVVTMNDELQRDRSEGKIGTSKKSERAYLIDELKDELHNEVSTEDFKRMLQNEQCSEDELSYDEWINAKLIAKLDHRYYVERLAKAVSLYILGDIYPDQIKAIDSGGMDAEEAKEKVSKLQHDVAERYARLYYPIGLEVKRKLKEDQKPYVVTTGDYDTLHKVFKEQLERINDTLNIKDVNKLLSLCDNYKSKQSKPLEIRKNVLRALRTNTHVSDKSSKAYSNELFELISDPERVKSLVGKSEYIRRKLKNDYSLNSLRDTIYADGRIQTQNDTREMMILIADDNVHNLTASLAEYDRARELLTAIGRALRRGTDKTFRLTTTMALECGSDED